MHAGFIFPFLLNKFPLPIRPKQLPIPEEPPSMPAEDGDMESEDSDDWMDILVEISRVVFCLEIAIWQCQVFEILLAHQNLSSVLLLLLLLSSSSSSSQPREKLLDDEFVSTEDDPDDTMDGEHKSRLCKEDCDMLQRSV